MDFMELQNISSNNSMVTSVAAYNTTTRSVLLALDIINFLFLAFCCYILALRYRRRAYNDPQELYLLNLAASAILANILLIVRDTTNLLRPLDNKIPSDLHTAFWCLNMAFVTGICYILVLARTFVTADRLMHVLLHLTYSQYWNLRKTKKLISITWFSNLSLSLGLSLLTYFKFDYVRYEAKISKMFAVYILTGVYLVFLLFVVIAYTLMFLSHARPRKNSAATELPPSLFRMFFVKSRFFISLVLGGAYLVLTVVPSLTRSIRYIAEFDVPYSVTFWYLVSTRVSFTADGVIYIFLKKDIRKFLRRSLCKRKVSP